MRAGRRLEALCLLYLYLVWGTSYLANRFVLDGLPPFLAAGSRFFVAGLLTLAGALWFLWSQGWLGHRAPPESANRPDP